MQYSFTKACLLALATTTSVLAQIPGFNVLTAPTSNEVVEAGSKFTIKWTPSDPAAPISLVLMQGKDAQHLDLASDFIATAIDSAAGQFEWSVPASATFAAYGIKLQLDSDPEQFQYSNPFTIAGGSDASESTTTSAAEPTTSESAKSTTTIQVSQISTAPTTSSTKALSTSTAPKPTSTTTTSSTSTSEEPSSTVESTTAPSTTEAPSTTLETSIAVPTSTEAPTATASPTLTGAAPRNAIVGGGLLGAVVMVFALL